MPTEAQTDPAMAYDENMASLEGSVSHQQTVTDDALRVLSKNPSSKGDETSETHKKEHKKGLFSLRIPHIGRSFSANSASDSNSPTQHEDSRIVSPLDAGPINATNEVFERNGLTGSASEHLDHHDRHESSKAKSILSILKRFIGVKDIATVRFSLPSQLLEPIGNLEYWNYLDRPDYFVNIPDHVTPETRMLAVVRWSFTKEAKYVHGKVVKPYNSILGEFFRCHWTVQNSSKLINIPASTFSNSSLEELNPTVAFLCEQISHSPPVSAFYARCLAKGIELYGVDQISAKFTGMSIKVQPGEQNLGIFIRLTKWGEEYQISHPTALVSGFLRGHYTISIHDTIQIKCQESGLNTMITYIEEHWYGKNKFALKGAIYRVNEHTREATKLEELPDEHIIYHIHGTWRGKIYYSEAGIDDENLLVDLEELLPMEKLVPDIAQQEHLESRKVWENVTSNIIAKQYSKATKEKIAIEERQRRKAEERRTNNLEYTPRFFHLDVVDGRPKLTQEGEIYLNKEAQTLGTI